MMTTERDDDVPLGSTSRDDAAAFGVKKHGPSDVEQWRESNLQDEDRGPVSHDKRHTSPPRRPDGACAGAARGQHPSASRGLPRTDVLTTTRGGPNFRSSEWNNI